MEEVISENVHKFSLCRVFVHLSRSGLPNQKIATDSRSVFVSLSRHKLELLVWDSFHVQFTTLNTTLKNDIH